jgi:hypothetical protein
MYQPYRAEIRGLIPHSAKPRNHFRPVGVCAIAIDNFNTRVQGDVIPENVKNGLPLDYPPTQSMLSLKTDDEYRVSWIAGALRKMVKNPTILHHPGRGDDDHRPVYARECL